MRHAVTLPPPGAALTAAASPGFPGLFSCPQAAHRHLCRELIRAIPGHALTLQGKRKAPGQVSLPPGLFRGSRHGLLSPGRSGSLRNQRTTGVAMMLAWILLLLLLRSRSGLLTP